MAGKQMMIVQEYLSQHSPIETINGNDAFRAMKAYAKQQQEIAVEKALEMCSSLSKEMIYDRDNLTKEESKGLILRNFQVCYATSKQEILSLKPEILKELKKWVYLKK